ncbi:MAG: tol-pal system-associated acyl-CoA thioesterase [Beijerinckiaceae bacterium]|nr:tol-pal system-associated acyl-CoA thioesterase [Beijerinckiaceae bacterium]
MSETHSFPIRVYYEDTDFSGVVYHASYLRFMERARTEFLRELGVDQRRLFMASPPVGFAVRHMEIDFLKAALMDDELIIETASVNVGGATLDLEQSVMRGAETLVSAKVRIACVSNGRACRLPDEIRSLLGT